MLFFLMHENEKVLAAKFDISYNLLSRFYIKEIYKKELFPYGMDKSSNDLIKLSSQFHQWWEYRYYNARRINFHIISNQVGCEYRNRNYWIHQSNSIFTHGASLLDHYWLNPVEPYYIDRGLSDSLVTFTVYPDNWENVNFETKEFSPEVGNVMLEAIMDTYNAKHDIRESINLNSPDFTLPGKYPKRWIRKNNELYCEKIYENTEAGIANCEKQIQIGKIVKEINPYFSLEYFPSSFPNTCYSKRFLGPNEEFINIDILIDACINENNKKAEIFKKKQLTIKDIFKMAQKHGCNKKLIKEYEKTIRKLKEELNSEKTLEESIENIGFIMDSKTLKIIRPAPIFGTSW